MGHDVIEATKDGHDGGERPLLLTKQQVCDKLSIGHSTLYNLHRGKKLRGHKVGKELRWTPDSVQAYVKELYAEDS